MLSSPFITSLLTFIVLVSIMNIFVWIVVVSFNTTKTDENKLIKEMKISFTITTVITLIASFALGYGLA